MGGESPLGLLFWVIPKPCKGDKRGTVAVDCWRQVCFQVIAHLRDVRDCEVWATQQRCAPRMGGAGAVTAEWERAQSGEPHALCVRPIYLRFQKWFLSCSGNSKIKFLKFEKMQYPSPWRPHRQDS